MVFGVVIVLLQIFIPYQRYAPRAKWLTLALFAYVAVVFVGRTCRGARSLRRDVLPARRADTRDYLMMLVAVLGTTISPYLFFWQASQEVEEQRAADGAEPLRDAPEQARAASAPHQVRHLDRHERSRTCIAFCIMLTAAVTLHAAGITDIQTSAQAAEALRPLAGEFAFALFALGIIGTGLLAVPVLAGSAAYAVAEAMRWPIGPRPEAAPRRKGFYAHHRGRHAARRGDRLHADRPDQGAVLGRRHQRRHRGADHGGDDAHGRAPGHHGDVRHPPPAARLGWLATGVMGLTVVGMLVSFFV